MARKSRYTDLVPAAEGPCDTAGIYLRLSVEDGDDLEHNSIGNQRKICLDHLAGRDDIAVGMVYIDNGRTGMDYKRPGFQAMFADLEAKKINCVVVKDVSRLGRNYILTSEYVEKIFPAMGVRLICVNDGYDSKVPDSDRDALLMPFKLIMNDSYVKDTARKIRSSIQAKMRCGEYLPSSSSVPYGYLRAPQEGSYDIDEETAPIVRRIFELRGEGTAFNKIARMLIQENVPSPGKLRYDRGLTKAEKYRDALWVRGTVRKIAGDPAYLGCRIHGRLKRDRSGGDKKNRPKEEWQVIPDAHPAIIDQALFDKVQEVNRAELEKRSAYERSAPPKRDLREIFQDKVFCGDCGAKMSARKYNARKGGKAPNSIFFNCNRYMDSSRQRCGDHRIRQEVLMDALRHFLDSQVELTAETEELRTVKQHPNAELLASLSCRCGNLKAKLERLLEDLVSGVLEKEEYVRIRQSYLEELSRLEQQERDARELCQAQSEAAQRLEIWLASLRRYQKIPAIDRQLMDALVERIEVFQDRSIRIHLTYGDPYEQLASSLEQMKGAERYVG